MSELSLERLASPAGAFCMLALGAGGCKLLLYFGADHAWFERLSAIAHA